MAPVRGPGPDRLHEIGHLDPRVDLSLPPLALALLSRTKTIAYPVFSGPALQHRLVNQQPRWTLEGTTA
jgi:hypothetical protein